MQTVKASTIAQLLFTDTPALDFASVVREVDGALSDQTRARRKLDLQEPGIAMFDLDGARIALGYADDLPGRHHACLTVSVGRTAPASVPAGLEGRGALCRKLTTQLVERHLPDEVLWHEINDTVTPEVIGRMLSALSHAPVARADATVEVDRLMERMAAELKDRVAQPAPPAVGAEPAAPVRAAALPAPAPAKPLPAPPPVAAPQGAAPPLFLRQAGWTHRQPGTPLTGRQEDNLGRVRSALYDAAPPREGPSTPLRLATHAMNASLVAVALPIGAALMAYSIIRGEDMRVTGRVMVLTGGLLALRESGVIIFT